jgi:hypothetical protein
MILSLGRLAQDPPEPIVAGTAYGEKEWEVERILDARLVSWKKQLWARS